MKSRHGKLLRTTALISVLVATMVSPLPASSSTVRDYNFDTSANLTENFNIKVGPNTDLSHISVSTSNGPGQTNWGINNTGGLRINVGSLPTTENRAIILSTKERYTVKNAPVDSVYKFSLFTRSYGAGYAGIGFTADTTNTTSGNYPVIYRSTDALGVSMHGGGFLVHNGANGDIARDWDDLTGGGVTTLTRATCTMFINDPAAFNGGTADDCASPSGWYRLDMTLTKKASSTFDLRLEVFRSSATGDITNTGFAADSSAPNAPDAAFQVLGLSNPVIANSGSLASYINIAGGRFQQLDGYRIELTNAQFVTAPSAPGTPTATPGVGTVDLAWTAPTSGTAPFTYDVISAPSLPAGASCTVDQSARTASCSGLTDGTGYSFIVEASNDGGSTDSLSSASVTFTAAPPGTPGTPTAVPGNGSATVSVVAPSSGGPVASYTVTASPGGATCTVTPPATSCVVSGLTNGTSYTFTSTARNGGGNSVSANSNAVTPLAPPGTPGTPTVVPGNGSATVSVVAPSSGGPVASYTVTASPGGATCTVTPPATSCVVSGLTNGTSYTFASTATNASGTSAPSSSSTATTAGAPSSGGSSATPRAVSFDPNGGVGSPSVMMLSGSNPLPSSKFTRKGYVLNGWNTKRDGSGVAYSTVGAYAFNSNVTLFAQWVRVKPAVSANRFVYNFAGNRADLSPAMRTIIASWVRALPRNASITCQGSTAGIRVTPFDRSLAQSRAKNVCEQALKTRSDLKYSIKLNPSSANRPSARHVLLSQN